MSALPTASLHALGSTAVVVTTDRAALAPARRILVRALRAVDLACSRFRDDSELTALNRAAGRPLVIGEDLWDALTVALEVARRTGGLVDPTVGGSLRAAGYDRTFVRLRLRGGQFRPVFEPAGRWREVELDASSRSVYIPSGVELDLGATAKAHAADRIAASAAEHTRVGVLVSLGGDIAVAGRAPDGGWAVRIAGDHRADPSCPGPAVAVTSGGLASSGTLVRRWRVLSGEIHHIVDPITGRPARTPWRTVTVAAASCVDANAASTASIVLGERAPGWLAARSLPARLERDDGSVLCLGGWPPEAEAA